LSTVEELLREAALGRVGVDRVFLRKILDANDPAGILVFARGPSDDHRVQIDPLLVDVFRHYQTPEALDFLIDVVRRNAEDVSDDLILAFLPFGEKAIDPLLALYHELGEEQGADIAFLLAGLHIRDSRIFELLHERLEYDAADGAFLLGLYGDTAARPALEKMLAEIPKEDQELRREISFAMEQLHQTPEPYQPEPFDILREYPERDLPAFDLLPEVERLEMLTSEDPLIRAGAARSFFNVELNAKSRAALLDLAKSDPESRVRGRAWESLADATEDRAIRDAMVAVLNDESRPAEERGGAAVGLYAVADQDDARLGIEALYEAGGPARAKALEAMWRSLWQPYATFFPVHLTDSDPKIVREALRGAGYFELTRYSSEIAKYFDAAEPFDHLREDALFAYALAMPGETTRGRIRGMLRKLESITPLTSYEAEVVQFALDERLRLHGLQPVFSADEEDTEPLPEPPAPAQKPGRNDPCPCGSGKKYKKCCGA
jgi:SEC-C motif-containing protein